MFLFCFLITSLLTSRCIGYASMSSHSNKLVPKHFSKNFTDSSTCHQDAVCTPIQNASCFGTMLPYSFTSVALAEDSISHFEVLDNLALWQGLRSVPRCWAVIQPLLCAVYMPKCENGSVFLPSQEMCRITRGPCRTVEVKHSWPPFLRCENKTLFPPRCRNPLQEVKFNTSYKCISPLVETDNPDSWFHEIEGCGIQCQDPFFSEDEHNSTHRLIAILASLSFLTTLFTVITFGFNWKVVNRYPEIIIFYISGCLFIVSLVWLIQFLPGAREEMTCLYDGTTRRRQPKSGEHLCTITFVLIYFFLMKSIIWFVILTYAWYIRFHQPGSPEDTVQKKGPYFQCSAWSIPFAMTTAVLYRNEVDGDYMSGICFVGYSNMNMRVGFLLVPVSLATVIASFFIGSVLCNLIKVKLNSEEVANLEYKKKIHRVILKIGLFSAIVAVLIICTFACHAYDFLNRKEWDDSLREYLICLAMNSANTYSSMGEVTKCTLRSKPSIVVVRLNLFCFFAFGIIMAPWIWTRPILEFWKRSLYRCKLCEPAEKNAATIRRHRLISKAFQRRNEINQGHISFSLVSSHDDPLGMNLDSNSIASRDISSTWANALPQFLYRRNAVASVVPFLPRQYSSASDVSRHISLDSFNQGNLDSLSMQISEQEYVAHALRHQRRKTRKERERFLRANRIAPWFPGSRRGSDTSLQSSLMAATIAAAAKQADLEAKVTKATSTGDLGTVPLPPSAMLPPVIMPPVNNRPQIQRQTINPPFTHGMTDNSHRLDRRVPSVASALGGINSSHRFTPNPCSVIPNSLVGMARPVCTGSYDMANSMPYGYLAGSMYPSMNGLYPGYSYSDYAYNSYGTLPYGSYTPYNNQFQQNILPMHMTVDSSSEAEFFPIIMSDSEYTDTGQRSYDETQLLTAQLRIIQLQEQMQAQAAAAAAAGSPPTEHSQPKPGLEPQACAKTQFLKVMGSFNAKTDCAVPQSPCLPSDRRSPHNEAPPPSPIGSSKSLNDDDLDDVFDVPGNNLASTPLPHVSETEGVFHRIKSQVKRAASFIQNGKELESLELTSRPCHSSLGQLPKISSPLEKVHKKEILKEKWLHESEGTNLINGASENVSR